MERKMLFQKIRDNNLQQKCYEMYGTNYTHLKNEELIDIINTLQTKTTCGIDMGARKAIKAIAAALGIKDIEKNF